MNRSSTAEKAHSAATTPLIDWGKLAQIAELREYFAENFTNYRFLIEVQRGLLQSFGDQELDNMAKIRVLEVTNGCLQWSFRRQDPECLSAEQTRECMQVVVGFIKRKQLYFPSQGLLTFAPDTERYLGQNRQLYHDAFKNNVPGAKRDFYAASTAQFIEFGRQRIEAAMDLVQQDYQSLFTPHFIERGRRYIAPYLDCLSQ
jgi:hypothetical protein